MSTYPLRGDDAWWNGRCRTCRHHGAAGECWRDGAFGLQDGSIVPMVQTPDALAAKCWEARKGDAMMPAQSDLLALLRSLYSDGEIVTWLLSPQPLHGGRVPLAHDRGGGGRRSWSRRLQQITDGVFV